MNQIDELTEILAREGAEALAALDDDLDTRTAIRVIERGAGKASASAKPSLRLIARRVLGIL